ncbi:MAG TPA: HAMP domain-containing sensor histidine kinase, partial [Polyangiaceae bacterium]|nr:HAMP domain-containing sensor histidine kinase [Polyangiaceae bacterium]
TLEIPVEPVTRHDGAVNFFHTVKTAIRAEDGRVLMTVGVSRNIGETLELREQLLRSREQLERDRLSTFGAQLPGFLFQLRLAGNGLRFTFVSNRVDYYYGVGPSELTADPARFFARVDDPERVRNELQEALRKGSAQGSAVTHVHKACGSDGAWRWMELLARAQVEADGSVTFHGYVHDISARHRVEKEREELVEKVSARNQEMEQFTYTISHDLKSPLVTIRGYLGGIEEDIRGGKIERALADIGRVRAAAEKMSRMLAELLEISRVGRIANAPVEVRVADVVAETKELLAARLTGVEVVVDVGDAQVCADRTRLVQVFQNLVENAVKYMGAQPAPRVTITSRLEGDYVSIAVADNGMGIAPAHHQRIFGLFEKLNARSEGTGVGLALVKTIVELHRGKVWVDSEGDGKGSTFHVRLPCG